jgi:type VI secretion system secreted protein VgrG
VSALAKRIIRSGVTTGTGHEIELDDTEQSVTITTSTKQKITLDPGKIELTNLAGTVKITLDNAGQSVSITAAASLKLEAPQITLKGATVEVNGTAMTTVKSGAAVNVTAPMVKIN